MGMFSSFIGKIKKRVIQNKVELAIDDMAGFYDIFGKYLGPNSSAMCKSSFDHVIHAEKFDEMLEGTEMVLNGLQLIVQGAKTIDVKAIKRENKAIAKASGMDAEMEAYSEKGFDGLKELIELFIGKAGDRDDLHPDNFKVGDDVTESVKAHPDKWREETPEAVKTFSENLEKNMRDAS